jgi:hypothetical protein
MLLAYFGGARMVDRRMVEAAVIEYDTLFSALHSQASGENGTPVRRWLGGALEAVALRMLALAGTLNPHEIHAFEERTRRACSASSRGREVLQPRLVSR